MKNIEEIKKLIEKYLNDNIPEDSDLYNLLVEDYCIKNCKYLKQCDWVPMNCPIIQYKYLGSEAVKNIKNFDIDKFDPIKYYWGES
ncbi:MAG: hypothetical protein IJ842_05880 [Bacilli bacterium]|nr:hypothetical protein [Bacilli bacterium]